MREKIWLASVRLRLLPTGMASDLIRNSVALMHNLPAGVFKFKRIHTAPNFG